MSKDGMLLCYNKGCGQRFNPNNNADDSCIFHPGVPVFHDAYKGWSCCNKKTTDFTDFLNIRGCTTSFHNQEKTPEAEKKNDQSEPSRNSPEYKGCITPKAKPIQRPSESVAVQKLKTSVTNSLKTEILKLSQKSEKNCDLESLQLDVKEGTNCKNGGCFKSYVCEADNAETCMHHPGFPVFHEGMKFWTCCMRRTTDFDSFLEQAGCTTGSHVWIKLKTENDIKQSCRYDWYQTGPYVFISVYAKIPIPEMSFVEGNQVKLHAYVVFGEDHDVFDLDLRLFGIIDLDNSSVQFAVNKVEIKLKKAEALQWAKLALPRPSADSQSLAGNLEDNLDESLKL